MASEKNKHIRNRLITILLAFAMVITSCAGFAAGKEKTALADEKQVTFDDYELVAESDTYKMYLYEPRLSVILENKETGVLIESTLSDANDDGESNKSWNAYMKSGIVLTAIIGTTNTYQVDLVSAENIIDVTHTDNGFSARITFKKYGFELTMNVSLEGDELIVEVPVDSIVESKADNYISTISLYPFMGYTYLDEKSGYMFIPDGNGALIYLDDKEGRYTTGFSQMIYGSDAGFSSSSSLASVIGGHNTVNEANKVLSPVFGMAHTDEKQAYLAVVESGAERASVEAHPNGVMVNYNRCFAKFLIRDIYVQPLNNSNSGTVKKAEADRNHENLRVRYILLDGEDADYAGMAVAYREYLLKNGLVEKKNVDYSTRVDFLGSDREEWLVFTKAVAVTTVDNIEEIYKELKEAGVTSLLSVYKGWQKGGVNNYPVEEYKTDSSLGSTSALTKLIKNSALDGYRLFLYNNALLINPDENNAIFGTIKKINKRTFELETEGQVYNRFLYLTPAKTKSLLTSFLAKCSKKQITNIALAGVTNNIFSYGYQGVTYNRYDTAEAYEELIAKAADAAELALEQPYMFLWKYTDSFLDMPLGSSDYMYTDEEVPFLSIVLKGIMPMYSEYVNFEANKTEFMLQMAEAGVYPSFYVTYKNSSELIYTNSSNLYSTEYATYKNTIIEYDRIFADLNEKTGNSSIVDHEKLADGVVKVSYDNGAAVYVNYTSDKVNVEGQEMESQSFKVVVSGRK